METLQLWAVKRSLVSTSARLLTALCLPLDLARAQSGPWCMVDRRISWSIGDQVQSFVADLLTLLGCTLFCLRVLQHVRVLI